jgi:hypothetical protein
MQAQGQPKRKNFFQRKRLLQYQDQPNSNSRNVNQPEIQDEEESETAVTPDPGQQQRMKRHPLHNRRHFDDLQVQQQQQ